METPAVYMDMTAEENLKQQYLILGLPSYDGIPGLLKLVGLEDTGKKKVKNFSMGMKQRLGIAIALAGDPDLLVLDEPVNGLDPQGIVEIRELIPKLNRERRITVPISSHILDELSRLATHYGIIDHGRMVKRTERRRAGCCLPQVYPHGGKRYRDPGPCPGFHAPGVQDHLGNHGRPVCKAQCNAACRFLAEEGCEVLSMTEKDESLESYYLSPIGGGSHD